MCGALALLLVRAGERERALRVFAAVQPGTEDADGVHAQLTDPAGAMRRATREARELLGSPPMLPPDAVDLEAVVQAAIGTARAGVAD